MGGLLWRERGRGHARLGVDLQKDQIVLNIVITKVGSGHAAATQSRVRELGLAKRRLENMGRQLGRKLVDGSARRVFGFVIVETFDGRNVRYRQRTRARSLPHHRDAQLTARDVWLDHDLVPMTPD